MTLIEKIKAVEAAITTAANLTDTELHSQSRVQNVADARAAVWWLLRKRLGLSYKYIGRYYSRDHTTVLRAVERVQGTKIASVAQLVIEKHAPEVLRTVTTDGPRSVDNWVC